MIKLNIQRFGHTNSTQYYELPQFVGTDKPQWLTDINQGFLAIDTAIHNAYAIASLTSTNVGDLTNLTTTVKTDIVSSINEVDGDLGDLSSIVAGHTTAIGNNTTAIGTLANLTTTTKTDLVSAVNEVDNVASNNATSIGTLSNLDTTEKSNLVGAINEVNGHIEVLNINDFTTYNASDLQITGGSIVGGNLTVAKNSDGSICKVYGVLSLAKTNQISTITIPNTGLTPSSEFNVYPSGFEMNNAQYGIQSTNTVFKTNGNIEITSYGTPAGGGATTILFPVVIFVKDFGDTPAPTP